MKHYAFVKCNGPVEFTGEERLFAKYRGAKMIIIWFGDQWLFHGPQIQVTHSDWRDIEILREVEGVVMSREQCEGLFTAGENYSEGQYRKLEYGEPNEFPDKETTINNLFK